MVIVCMDANFRLKNNLVSNYSQDPGLGTGWAYMLERKPYEKYVLSRTNDQDVSFVFLQTGLLLTSACRSAPASGYVLFCKRTREIQLANVIRVLEREFVGDQR